MISTTIEKARLTHAARLKERIRAISRMARITRAKDTHRPGINPGKSEGCKYRDIHGQYSTIGRVIIVKRVHNPVSCKFIKTPQVMVVCSIHDNPEKGNGV